MAERAVLCKALRLNTSHVRFRQTVPAAKLLLHILQYFLKCWSLTVNLYSDSCPDELLGLEEPVAKSIPSLNLYGPKAEKTVSLLQLRRITGGKEKISMLLPFLAAVLF